MGSKSKCPTSRSSSISSACSASSTESNCPSFPSAVSEPSPFSSYARSLYAPSTSHSPSCSPTYSSFHPNIWNDPTLLPVSATNHYDSRNPGYTLPPLSCDTPATPSHASWELNDQDGWEHEEYVAGGKAWDFEHAQQPSARDSWDSL